MSLFHFCKSYVLFFVSVIECVRVFHLQGFIFGFGEAYYLWNDEEGAASSEYGLNNFSQNWTKDACITESHIYQVISELPQGTYILKAESEVASINMVYGGAAAGKRVLTSSSSPGVALMQEGIAYMAGAEVPGVFVNVQRGGPGLGTIQPSQSDYFQLNCLVAMAETVADILEELDLISMGDISSAQAIHSLQTRVHLWVVSI